MISITSRFPWGRAAGALAVIVLGAALPAAAGAVPIQIAVSPQQVVGGHASSVGYFQARVRPGRGLRGVLVIRNTGSRPARVALDPVDAITTQNLGSAYKLRGTPAHGSTRWIRLGARRLTIPPRRVLSVGVAVQVPRGTRAGDYLSGVSVQQLGQRPSQTKPRKGAVISSVSRYAVGALVRVPGPRHPLIRFHGASVEYAPAGVTFHVRAANEGNALLQGVRGTADVYERGARILSAQIGPGTFVDGTGVDLPLLLRNQQPPEGTAFRVKAMLRYGPRVARLDQKVVFGKRQAETQHQYGGPKPQEHGGLPAWVWSLVGVALVLIGSGAIALWRRRGRGPLSHSATRTRIDRELAAASASERPLSVVMIHGLPERRGDRAKVLSMLRARMRTTDEVGEVDGGLAVILPDTGREAAAGQALDISRALGEVNGGARVGSATADGGVSPEELLALAIRNAQTDS